MSETRTPGAAIGAVAPTADPLIVADAAADARVDAVAATVFVHHAPGASPFGPRPDPGRRRLLGLGLGLASGGCVLPRVGAATAAVLRPTPALTAGPFYPRQRPAEVDADLGGLAGHAARALGVPFLLDLLVLDARGRPVPDAAVELWQANAHGRYAHPDDGEASGPLDPDFQGYAQLATDADGRLRVRSIVPGAYGEGRYRRTPHLHLILRGAGTRLVTQMFFPDQPLNADDFIYARLSPPARAAATARALPAADGARAYGWDVVLPAG